MVLEYQVLCKRNSLIDYVVDHNDEMLRRAVIETYKNLRNFRFGHKCAVNTYITGNGADKVLNDGIDACHCPERIKAGHCPFAGNQIGEILKILDPANEHHEKVPISTCPATGQSVQDGQADCPMANQAKHQVVAERLSKAATRKPSSSQSQSQPAGSGSAPANAARKTKASMRRLANKSSLATRAKPKHIPVLHLWYIMEFIFFLVSLYFLLRMTVVKWRLIRKVETENNEPFAIDEELGYSPCLSGDIV